VVNRDGSGRDAMTQQPDNRISRTLVASGHRSTSIRPTAVRRRYVIGVDGLNLSKKNVRVVVRSPTVVAGAVNEDRVRVAPRPRFGHPGIDLSTGVTKAPHLGEGTNESPASRRTARHMCASRDRQAQDLHHGARREECAGRFTKDGKTTKKPDWSK